MNKCNAVLEEELHRLNRLVYYSCTQVKLIDNEIDQLNIRYKRAQSNDLNTFRYLFRLRLATYEDTRTSVLQYAKDKARRMDEIEEILIENSSQ